MFEAHVFEHHLGRLEVRSLRPARQAFEALQDRRALDLHDRLIDGRDTARRENRVQCAVLAHQFSSRVRAMFAISIIAFGLCRNASAPRLYDSRSISGVPNALSRITRVSAQRRWTSETICRPSTPPIPVRRRSAMTRSYR